MQEGSAFICDAEGRILRVLQDGLKLLDDRRDPSLISIVAPDQAAKAEEFLHTLQRDGAAFGWEMTVVNGKAGRIYFTGGHQGEGGILVAVTSACDVGNVCQEFLRMLNEQTNALRSAMKELSQNRNAQTEKDHEIYGEFSRLNNELVTLQRELAKKNSELARANALKTRFLGMASHDLRKPLSVLLMYTEFLAETVDHPLDSKQLEHVDTIRQTTNSMLRNINDFLDVAQIESGRLKLTLSYADLAAIVKEQVRHQNNFAIAKSIEISCTLPKKPLMAQFDIGRMQQAIANLVENAVKYSPARSRVEVQLEDLGEKVLFAVRDQGIGIPPEAQKSLFNPFTTAGNPTGGEKSTGLGLAIVKAIATEHKGTVWFESEPGKGSTFYLTIPRHEAKT